MNSDNLKENRCCSEKTVDTSIQVDSEKNCCPPTSDKYEVVAVPWLECEIIKYIECLYNVRLKTKVHVDKLNPGYEVKLDLQNWQRPWHFATDIDDPEKFLELAKEQIRKQNLLRVEYWSLKREIVDPIKQCETNG